MGDVILNKNLYLLIAKAPTQTGAPITERDFAVDPAENVAISDYNEDETGRFSVPANASLTLPMGSVALGKFFAIRAEGPLGLSITNSLGTSPVLTLVPLATSCMHVEHTGLQVINAGSVVVKGRYCTVGD